MRQYLCRLVLAVMPIVALGLVGCVARVETDPAPARVNVDVDPPSRAPDVKVNVD